MSNWHHIKAEGGAGDRIFFNVTDRVGCLIWELAVDTIGVQVWHQVSTQVCQLIREEVGAKHE